MTPGSAAAGLGSRSWAGLLLSRERGSALICYSEPAGIRRPEHNLRQIATHQHGTPLTGAHADRQICAPELTMLVGSDLRQIGGYARCWPRGSTTLGDLLADGQTGA